MEVHDLRKTMLSATVVRGRVRILLPAGRGALLAG